MHPAYPPHPALLPAAGLAQVAYNKAVFGLDARRTPGGLSTNVIQDLSANALRTASGTTGSAAIVQDGRGGKALRVHGGTHVRPCQSSVPAGMPLGGAIEVEFRWPTGNFANFGAIISEDTAANPNRRWQVYTSSGSSSIAFAAYDSSGNVQVSGVSPAIMNVTQGNWCRIRLEVTETPPGTLTYKWYTWEAGAWSLKSTQTDPMNAGGWNTTSTAKFAVGGLDSAGAGAAFSDLIGWARVLDASNNVLAEFNPSRDASFSSLSFVSSTTGETWTVTPGGSDNSDPLWLPYEGERYVHIPTGASQNNLSVAHAANQIPTDDLDILVRVRLPAWSGLSATQIFGQKTAFADPDRYWLVGALTTGLPRAQIWPAGTTASVLDLDAATNLATAGLVGGTTYWLRFTLDADDGAGNRVHEWFYAPDSTSIPTSWTSLGGATVAGAITWTAAGTAPIYMPANAASPAQDLFRFVVRHSIDGAAVLDWSATDPVNATHTSFTASTGQTVTVNRATSGRKTAVVEANKWLLGTDDYIEVADNALLDLDAATDFTVLWVGRNFDNSPNASLVTKRNTIASADTIAGWQLSQATQASGINRIFIARADGTAYVVTNAPNIGWTAGDLAMIAGTINSGGNLISYVDSTTSTIDGSAQGDSSNALPVRIGASSAASPGFYANFELYAVYIWREALTASELAAIAADWGAA